VPAGRRLTPSFSGLSPASRNATAAAQGASSKRDTRPELALRRAVWKLGLRYRVSFVGLPGRPDLVFVRPRIVVFCDGDFWHGRNIGARAAKLARGHNSGYWLSKIASNIARDQRNNEMLRAAGWTVLRYWESEIMLAPAAIAQRIAASVASSPSRRSSSRRRQL